MPTKLSTSIFALATIFAVSQALSADLGGGSKDPTSADYTAPVNWSGPWLAVLGGYSIATLTSEYSEPIGLSAEGGFVQGELGYDFQVNQRFVVGGYVCASYSAIEGLADGYCVQGRGGYLLTPSTLLFGNVGWRWQGTDAEGEDNIYASGPVGGIGIESKFSQNLAVKLSYEHHWITDVDGETVDEEIDLGDNRVMAGIVLRMN